MAFPQLKQTHDSESLLVKNKINDCVILVSSQVSSDIDPAITQLLAETREIDNRLGNEVVMIHSPLLAGGRFIHSPTGLVDRDYDDVRNFGDAAAKAIALAKNTGSVNPLIIVDGIPLGDEFLRAIEVCYLSACQRLWQPLEARESLQENVVEPVRSITLFTTETIDIPYLMAVESGRRLARDLAGTEPERFSPPHFADYCEQAMQGTSVQVSVIKDRETIEQQFPLLAAVARASQQVKRHQPRVVKMVYEGDGPIEKTLILVGKAVTYDTGGADVKVGGHMAGMSRDKGGAAAVAGFVKTVAQLKPKGLKVVAYLGVVRNSIGSDCFVADEIIKAHSGVRVRIGNTDAEGRLVMADLLSQGREIAKNEVSPELMTIATLTGHAALSVGPYTIMIDNGAARQNRVTQQLETAGEAWGDCIEAGRSRREDWDMIKPHTQADDVLSSNNGPSVSVARGHQFPMAFLALSSGLDKHHARSETPLCYTHIDIAGSGVEGGNWQHGKPTGAPLVALAARYLSK